MWCARVGHGRVAAAVALLATLGGRAGAAEDLVGTRALGMGGALRGAATGDSGPLLNPSGMSMIRSYSLEAAYGHSTRRSDEFFHGSIVDTTSGFKIGGGAYYTYHSTSPAGLPGGSGHEGGLALSVPFGDKLALGGTAKYFSLSGEQAAVGNKGGLTFDVGATVRPVTGLSVGMVGTNVRNLHNPQAPRALGYGIAFNPGAELIFVLDGVTTFTAPGENRRKGTSVMGGGEIFLAGRFAVRAGGGFDASDRNGYFSLGFSAISEIGALDLGGRRDTFRGTMADGSPSKLETILGVSLRLFVPQP